MLIAIERYGPCLLVRADAQPDREATPDLLRFMQELSRILLHPDVNRNFGVAVNCTELAHQHLDVVSELVNDPQATLSVLDEALRLAQEQILGGDAEERENMARKVWYIACRIIHNQATPLSRVQCS